MKHTTRTPKYLLKLKISNITFHFLTVNNVVESQIKIRASMITFAFGFLVSFFAGVHYSLFTLMNLSSSQQVIAYGLLFAILNDAFLTRNKVNLKSIFKSNEK